MKHSKKPIAPEDRVSTPRKIGWGMGGVTDSLTQGALAQMVFPVFNLGLGLSPVMISYAVSISRLFDAITDPLIGNLSDNSRSRWGRRKPFIVVGALSMVLSFFLIWIPPAGLSPFALTVWLAASVSIFMLAYTLFAVPYSALGYEMTSDPTERAHLLAYRAFFAVTSQFIAPWLYWFMLRPTFGGTEVSGAPYAGALVGIIFVVFALPSVFCGRENAKARVQEKIKFLRSVMLSLKSRPFRLLACYVVALMTGLGTVGVIPTYLNIFHVFDGDRAAATKFIGIIGMIFTLSGMVAIPLVSFLAGRFNRRFVLIAGLTLTSAGFLSSWWCYVPGRPWLQIVPVCMTGFGLSFAWVLNGTFLGDVCDADEVVTGLRREGMFCAMYGIVFKAGSAVTMVVSGYILLWCGISEGIPAPDAETIFRLRLAYPLVACLSMVGAITAMLFYPLTPGRVHEIKQQLANNRNS